MVTVRMMPRGLRNRNPLNIRHGQSRWQGMRARQTDREFVQFISPAYGYRAAFLLLRTYIDRHKCGTLEQVIHRWAPPQENLTCVYISRVVGITGMTADTRLKSDDANQMIPLVMAMSRVENGVPAMMGEVIAGWTLAQK